MSKFTTEVRYICETYANDPTLSIEETISKAKGSIFNDTWTTYEEDHKSDLEQKILRFYYTREIGYETVSLWKFKLNTKLSVIMPKYNVLYSALAKVKENLLSNVDVTEERTTNDKNTSETTTTGKTTTSNENTTKNDGTLNDTNTTTVNGTNTNNGNTTDTSESNSSSTGENKQSGSGTNSSDAWQKYADTPQGGLTGLENDTYMTNASHNLGQGSNTTESTSNATSSGTDKTSSTGTNSNTSTTDSTTTSNGGTETHNTGSGTSSGTSDTNTTANGNGTHEGTSTMHLIGKNNGTSYIDEYNKLVSEYNDIDMQIIQELDSLFMGLWE